MGKLKKIIFLCTMTVLLIATLFFVQLLPQNATEMQNNEDYIENRVSSLKNLEETFSFIIDRLQEIRNSADLSITEDVGSDSYNLKATAGDESVNVDESYQIQNVVNPDQTNQSLTTAIFSPTKNTTTAEIIMGFTYQLIKYKWEISWTLEIFGYEVAYAYFGIELDIGAAMRFPIELTVDYFTDLLIDQPTSVNVSLQTIDLPNFDETYFHFIGRIYAGVNAFGQNGEWSIGPNFREDHSYETPLGAGASVDLGELQIPILEIIGQLGIPTMSQIADIISSYVADILVKLRFSVGSNLLTMQAAIYGNETYFDGPTGPNSKRLNFTQSPETQSLTIYAKEPGPMRLELNDFQYHLNRLDITILLGLTWKTVFGYLFEDMEWEIYTFSIPLGNLFVFDASNTVTVQMNATTPMPPTEIYGVSIVYISPMESVELGKDIAEYFVFIENTGQNIEQDMYDIEVTGIDPTWVIYPPYLTVKQGSIGYFVLKIDPPRDYTSAAGVHPFTVTITSRGDPSETDTIAQNLYILPYYETQVMRTSLLDAGIIDVEPEITENVTFLVTNTGNIAETFNLSMTTNGLSCSIFDISSNVILAPGESIVINPNITVPKSSEFPALRYSVKVTAQSQTDPVSSASDTVQMNILPFKNLSISITELVIPPKIRAGSELIYGVYVENNGNFNDTIEVSLEGLEASSYMFGLEDQILFPGQKINTTLTVTIPSSKHLLKSEEYNLTFSAHFSSDETIIVTSSVVLYTTPNYLPFIILIIALGAVITSAPFIYRKAAPYIKRKLNTRSIRKYLRESEDGSGEYMKLKLETCPYCYSDLTEGELDALNKDLDTLCERCGKMLKPEYLEVLIPRQKSIDEVVSDKMKAHKAKQEQLIEKKKTDQRVKQYKKILAKKTKKTTIQRGPRKVQIEYCPHCLKDLSETDLKILQKGELTFCSNCRKIVKPEDIGI